MTMALNTASSIDMSKEHKWISLFSSLFKSVAFLRHEWPAGSDECAEDARTKQSTFPNAAVKSVHSKSDSFQITNRTCCLISWISATADNVDGAVDLRRFVSWDSHNWHCMIAQRRRIMAFMCLYLILSLILALISLMTLNDLFHCSFCKISRNEHVTTNEGARMCYRWWNGLSMTNECSQKMQ